MHKLSTLSVALLAVIATTAHAADPVSAEYSGIPKAPPVITQANITKLTERPDATPERKEAYRSSANSAVPMTPTEITALRKEVSEAQKAETFRAEPRNPRIRDLPISTADVPTIYLAEGYSATILMYDASGNPITVAPAPLGAVIGDKEAINASALGNVLSLYVKKPWRSTNLTVFLQGFPVPVSFTVTSEKDPQQGDAVDYQIRARIMDVAASHVQRGDSQNIGLLMQLTNGLGDGGYLTPLPAVSSEESMPGSRLLWQPSPVRAGQFYIGKDGLTYALLRPGYSLIGQAVAQQRGADGSMGYIIAGNQPRIFTVQGSNGMYYRMTVQR